MTDATYYYAPGMLNPYWQSRVAHDFPEAGVDTTVAFNADADTDMGNLYGDEFLASFPNAFEISKEQYDGQAINGVDGLAWARLIARSRP